ncbi:hypothetical protein ACTMTI_39205 [Nonomuraea sp. H19]|uniref:hypothetical protein n=1 Tax=Nonomuraea sp. H19 TaxID=3452206 RepID=UPI003F890BE5
MSAADDGSSVGVAGEHLAHVGARDQRAERGDDAGDVQAGGERLTRRRAGAGAAMVPTPTPRSIRSGARKNKPAAGATRVVQRLG